MIKCVVEIKKFKESRLMTYKNKFLITIHPLQSLGDVIKLSFKNVGLAPPKDNLVVLRDLTNHYIFINEKTIRKKLLELFPYFLSSESIVISEVIDRLHVKILEEDKIPTGKVVILGDKEKFDKK